MIGLLRRVGFRATLRAHLLLVVFAGMLPMGLLAGALLIHAWQSQQYEVRRSVQDSAVALASAARSELDGSIRKLEFLARSPLATERTMAGFYKSSLDALGSSPEWENLSLSRPDGTQVFNLARPLGAPLPAVRNQPHLRRALADKAPAVSDVRLDPVTGQPVVEIAAPVFQGGDVRFVLAAALSPARFRDLLGRRTDAADGIAGIVDGGHRFIWRAGQEREALGTPAPDEIGTALEQSRQGTERFLMPNGGAVYGSWATVPGTSWHALYGVPSGPMEHALLQSLAFMSGGWAVCALAGILLTGVLSQRIARSMRLAAQAAEQASAGEPVRPIESTLREIESLGLALHRVSERVGREAALRRDAERARERLLAQEQEARARAEADNRAKDEFLAMLGHELRNPLAAIMNAAHLLDRVGPGAPEAKAAGAIVTRQSHHLRRMIDDLLDVGRVITGKIALERRPIDLSEAVDQALRTLAAAKRTDRHVVAVDRSSVWVDGDATRLEQIATNLVANAVTYSPPGTTIRVRVAREGAEAVFSVTDEGQGISADALPRVFELFYQADQALSRPRGGLGIGLTLVRRLADLHGGTVHATSPGEGRGSTFTVCLPALAAALPRAKPPLDRTAERVAQRILMVEDNEDARSTLRRLLELKGHDVVDAPDGPTALLTLERFRPEVALIDIGLPGMNGYELAGAIRAACGDSVRLVAVSGYGLPEHRRRSAEAGFEGHLVKPVDPAELERALEGRLSRAA